MNIELLEQMEAKAHEAGDKALRESLDTVGIIAVAARAKTDAIVKTVHEFKLTDFDATAEDFEEMKAFYIMSLKEEIARG